METQREMALVIGKHFCEASWRRLEDCCYQVAQGGCSLQMRLRNVLRGLQQCLARWVATLIEARREIGVEDLYVQLVEENLSPSMMVARTMEHYTIHVLYQNASGDLQSGGR